MGHAVQHVINSKSEPYVFGFDWEESRSGHLPIFGEVGVVIDYRHQAFVGIVVFKQSKIFRFVSEQVVVDRVWGVNLIDAKE